MSLPIPSRNRQIRCPARDLDTAGRGRDLAMSNPSIQVDSLIRELQVSSVHAQQLFAERTAEQLLHKPDEKSWSAAECLEHLNLSNRSYLSRLEPILAHLRSRNLLAVKPFRLNSNAALLKYWLEPPSRLRLPTSARFQPLRVEDWSGLATPFLRFESATGRPSRIVARTRARSSHARFALREEHEIQRLFRVCSHRGPQSPPPMASRARQPLIRLGPTRNIFEIPALTEDRGGLRETEIDVWVCLGRSVG